MSKKHLDFDDDDEDYDDEASPESQELQELRESLESRESQDEDEEYQEDSDAEDAGCGRGCCTSFRNPRDRPAAILATVCGSCCVILVIALVILTYVGWSQVALSKQKVNEQDPHITPLQFPRYNGCAGCKGGYKTDDELSTCLEPCTSLKFALDWEALAKKAGYSLVYLPSRPGPKGEATVNISAWWLPPVARPGVDPKTAPRIVALHGLGSNNNHCGVQATCFLLRAIGFGCLTPSVRDYGLSGKSSHPDVMTWAYDYHMDLLGAWDYAIKDPDGILGGPLPQSKVGIAGFSKGALGAAVAFGFEKRIPGAWIDSAPWLGLHGMVDAIVRPYAGGLLTPAIVGVVMASAKHFSGGRVDYFNALDWLVKCKGPQREVAISQGLFDKTVPIAQGEQAIAELGGLRECYAVTVYTPPEYCNAATHHQEMWEFPDDMREVMCQFWSKTFNQSEALCDLASLPKYQKWTPPFSEPPGTPNFKT